MLEPEGGGWIVMSHIGWGGEQTTIIRGCGRKPSPVGEQTTIYKGVETFPRGGEQTTITRGCGRKPSPGGEQTTIIRGCGRKPSPEENKLPFIRVWKETFPGRRTNYHL